MVPYKRLQTNSTGIVVIVRAENDALHSWSHGILVSQREVRCHFLLENVVFIVVFIHKSDISILNSRKPWYQRAIQDTCLWRVGILLLLVVAPKSCYSDVFNETNIRSSG